MTKFKQGDRVKCVDPYYSLTKGESYTVRRQSDGGTWLTIEKNDEGRKGVVYIAKRFVRVPFYAYPEDHLGKNLNPGNYVRCVEGDESGPLTKGLVYRVTSFNRPWVGVISDLPGAKSTGGWHMGRFALAPAMNFEGRRFLVETNPCLEVTIPLVANPATDLLIAAANLGEQYKGLVAQSPPGTKFSLAIFKEDE